MAMNALVYVIGGNSSYDRKGFNSMNSFARHNPDILGDLKVCIITDRDSDPDISLADSRLDVQVVRDLSFDYSKLYTRGRYSRHVYFKFELFGNPVFRDMDTAVFVDCDTVFNGSAADLFAPRDKPTLAMVPEPRNIMTSFADTYFNGGVVLVTPRLMGDELRQLAFKRLTDCAAARKWFYPDQCVFSAVFDKPPFRDMLVPLERRYNCFGRGVRWRRSLRKTRPVVTHYILGQSYGLAYLDCGRGAEVGRVDA